MTQETLEQIGLDLGYAATKIVADGKRVQFPSIVGTPERSAFRFGNDNIFTITIDGQTYNVGESAIEQSRFTVRQEDRDWYKSREYLVLLHAALSSIWPAGHHEIICVTGLPVAFYENDRAELKELFEHEMHIVIRDGKTAVPVNIIKCYVIPQVMGALLNEALNNEGQIVNSVVAEGRVGVIDIGGNTTNFLHAYKMGDIQRETTSINLGGWDAMRAVRPVVEEKCPDVQYADHEISQAIVHGQIRYSGEDVDLSDSIAPILEPMATQLIAKAKELWPGGGARLDTILLSGGGSLLLGEYIAARLTHNDVRVVEDSVFANASGYHKLAKFQQL